MQIAFANFYSDNYRTKAGSNQTINRKNVKKMQVARIAAAKHVCRMETIENTKNTK